MTLKGQEALQTMRLDIALAQWKFAQEMFDRHGPLVAPVHIQNLVGHGLTRDEANHIKFLVAQLAEENR